jgi:hypothetical protein
MTSSVENFFQGLHSYSVEYPTSSETGSVTSDSYSSHFGCFSSYIYLPQLLIVSISWDMFADLLLYTIIPTRTGIRSVG